MKFYEKYPQLQNKSFLSKILVDSVYSTMSLENQKVPKAKVTEIVSKILEQKQMQENAFFKSQFE